MTQLLELFPIELVWDEYDWRFWRKYSKSDSERFSYLKNSWEGLPSILFKNLERMPLILKAVIMRVGGFLDKKKIIFDS